MSFDQSPDTEKKAQALFEALLKATRIEDPADISVVLLALSMYLKQILTTAPDDEAQVEALCFLLENAGAKVHGVERKTGMVQ